MKRLPAVSVDPKNWRPSPDAARAVAAYRQQELERKGKAPSINTAINEMLVQYMKAQQ